MPAGRPKKLRAHRNDITAAYARDTFSYEPDTGILRRRIPPPGHAHLGLNYVAGTVSPSGHIIVKLDGRGYEAHRIIWLIVYGSWPAKDIDHANGIGTDNRLCNLREADKRKNGWNRGPNRNSKSGRKGVWQDPKAAKAGQRSWRAAIRLYGQRHHLGSFATADEAQDAYVNTARKYHGEFLRTSRPTR